MSLELSDGDQTLTISMNGIHPFIEICDNDGRYKLFTLVDEDDVNKVIDALFQTKRKHQLATVFEELAKTNSIIKLLGVSYCIEIFDTSEWNASFNQQIKGKLDAITKRQDKRNVSAATSA